MSASTAVLQNRGDRRRTSGSMLLSVAIHALVILFVLMQRPQVGGGMPLTEIDYVASLDPAPPAGIEAPKPAPPAPRAAETQEHFRRATPQAEEAPVPQSDYALTDQIAARLDRLRSDKSNAVVAAASAPVSANWSPAAPSAPGPARTSSPVALERGAPARAPLALSRGTPVQAARLDPATVATAVHKSEPEAPASATTAVRQLAGARLMGPVADRPIVHSVKPAYPEWAKRQAVEGVVTLHFYVRADGSIKENILVEKTAGFDDFDQAALAALREWRFQPLHAGRTGEQWGTITFQFRLRDAG